MLFWRLVTDRFLLPEGTILVAMTDLFRQSKQKEAPTVTNEPEETNHSTIQENETICMSDRHKIKRLYFTSERIVGMHGTERKWGMFRKSFIGKEGEESRRSGIVPSRMGFFS